MSRQIAKVIKKYVEVWKDAKDRDINEADIVTRIVKFLEDALGYDALSHITKEFQVKDRFVDLAIRINDKVKFYIEAKSANTTLKEGQIFQAESYAAQKGIEWVILTNGAEWQLYHLTFDKTGIEHTLVFNLNLISGNLDDNAEKLNYLSFDSVRKDELDDYWEKCQSLHAGSLIKALFHEDTLSVIRREIRRKTDIMLDEDEVLDGLKNILSQETTTAYADIIKIRRKRKPSSKDNGSENEKALGDSPKIEDTLNVSVNVQVQDKNNGDGSV